MKPFTDLRDIADSVDQPRREIVRIRRREADSREAGHVVHRAHERREIGRRREVTPVRVHRLAEERHFATAFGDEPPHLGDDGFGRVAPLAPARRRDHAERAVFLAALHHGDVRFEAWR